MLRGQALFKVHTHACFNRSGLLARAMVALEHQGPRRLAIEFGIDDIDAAFAVAIQHLLSTWHRFNVVGAAKRTKSPNDCCRRVSGP